VELYIFSRNKLFVFVLDPGQQNKEGQVTGSDFVNIVCFQNINKTQMSPGIPMQCP
jgi:hypothetical protein